MAEWSKAPDSSSGLRKRAWVQIPLLTLFSSLLLWMLSPNLIDPKEDPLLDRSIRTPISAESLMNRQVIFIIIHSSRKLNNPHAFPAKFKWERLISKRKESDHILKRR
ncbi:hypothetical protein N665_0254s0019 [Sinapis alba]|nr:hypothetical protein N665_0254s0019 [Sinapis alba]